MSEKLVLIDGHSILNRAFFGIPDLTNSEGLHTNAVYGFLNIMFKILEEEQPVPQHTKMWERTKSMLFFLLFCGTDGILGDDMMIDKVVGYDGGNFFRAHPHIGYFFLAGGKDLYDRL